MRFFAVLLLLVSLQGNAQDFPARPVRLLVGFPPGGAMDSVARVLSAKLTEALGQQFVVENRAGAAGAIAADALVKAPADGYVLLLAESGTLIVPSMNPKAAYDPLRQFAPVAGACSLPLAFVAAPGFPAANARELIAARTRAGLTQAELAKRMQTTQSTVARMESGRTLPSMRTLSRYAEATGSRAVFRLEKAAA